MKWSFKLGRILGIDVYIHFTFLLLLGFVGVAHALTGGGFPAAVTGVLFFACLFGCVLLHEFGHALMARRYGIPTRDITLLPIGGIARLERMPEKPVQELWVALAGPAVNLVIAAGLAIGLAATRTWDPLVSLSATQGNLVERLLAANVLLVAFNLIPAFPMDGGRVLRSLLAMRLRYAYATRIAARIGQGLAVVFALAGLFGNPLLLFIAFFVWFGAAQEASAVEMKSSFAGVPVREAMVTEFHILAPDTTVAEAARLLLAGAQQDFPVIEHGTVVGILAHSRLLQALSRGQMDTLVGDIMDRNFAVAADEEPLEAALDRMEPGRTPMQPVLANQQLVGLLTAENLGEFYIIHRARGRNAGGRPPGAPILALPGLVPPASITR